MRELVIFDLDNTLLKGYSQQMFLRFLFKEGIIKLAPYLKINIWFVFYKIGIIKDPKKIMEYAYRFENNWPVEKLEELVNIFFEKVIKDNIFLEGLELVKSHKLKGRELILISNSIVPIVKKIADYLDIENIIATELDIKNGKLTGKIVGEIMYGKNKVVKLGEFIKQKNLKTFESWAYSDHYSDLPILEKANNPVVVNPNDLLFKEATKRNWPILTFRKTLLDSKI